MRWSFKLFLINILPSLYFRYVYCGIQYENFSSGLLGALSDLLFVALAVAVISSLEFALDRKQKGRKVIPVVTTLLWWFYHAVITSYFYAMHTLPAFEQARYLVDLHFLAASLSLTTALGIVFSAFGLAWCVIRLGPASLPVKAHLFAVLFLVFVLSFLAPDWRQSANPLIVQIVSFLHSGQDEVLLKKELHLAHDLSGVPMLPYPAAKRPNVLVVVLEGIPGGYLRQSLDFVNQSGDHTMPKLSRWASKGFLVPNFLTHRNQTINGLYSLLCADYPRLFDGTLIVQELLAESSVRQDYMPRILARNGYATAYLQAAELRFMDKDRFMRLLGFEEVLGEEWFKKKSKTFFSRWGINDHDFFVQSLNKIQELSSKEKPWFLTLLTVGTHHPYTLPDTYTKEADLSPKLRSVSFLDDALDNFLSRLEKKGILKDTLVIVTSDESHGMDADILLAGNWGLCLALVPQRIKAPMLNPGLFGLVDLPLSILDYTGLSTSASADSVAGRSIFRDYGASEKRTLLGSWGSRLFVVSGDAVLMKDFGSDAFVKYRYAHSPFTISNTEQAEAYTSGTEIVNEASRLSQQVAAGKSEPVTYHILPENSFFKIVEPRTGETKTWLSGGQYIQLKKGERYVLDLEVLASPSNTRNVRLDGMFYKLNGTFLPFISNGLIQLPFLAPGEKLVLSCIIDVKQPFMLDSVRLAAWTQRRGKTSASKKTSEESIEIKTFVLRQIEGRKHASSVDGVFCEQEDIRMALGDFFLTTSQGERIEHGRSTGSVYGGYFYFIPAVPASRDLSPVPFAGTGFDADGRTLAARAAAYFYVASDDRTTEKKLFLTLRPHNDPHGVSIECELFLNGNKLDIFALEDEAEKRSKKSYVLVVSDLLVGWNELEFRLASPVRPFDDGTEFADWPGIYLEEFRVEPVMKR